MESNRPGPGEAEAAPTRIRLVEAIPFLLAFVGGLLVMFAQRPLVDRLAYSILFGLFLPVGGLLSAYFAEYFLRWLAGLPLTTSDITTNRNVRTLVVLVFVVVWNLGAYWRVSERARIARCLREIEAGAAMLPGHASASWYCTEEFEQQRYSLDRD